MVLGGDEGKECTYTKGYMKRQATSHVWPAPQMEMLEFALPVACLAMTAMRYISVWWFYLVIPNEIVCWFVSASVGDTTVPRIFLLRLSIATSHIALYKCFFCIELYFYEAVSFCNTSLTNFTSFIVTAFMVLFCWFSAIPSLDVLSRYTLITISFDRCTFYSKSSQLPFIPDRPNQTIFINRFIS